MKFEFSILDGIRNALGCPFMDKLMVFISTLGNGGVLWILCGVLMLFFKRTRKYGFFVFAGLLCCELFGNQIIKNIVCRPRPCHIANVSLLIDMPRGFSFPSGHTFSSFVAATVIAKCDRRFGYASIPMAALIAFSRLYLYVHFPTDILGGIAFGIGFALLSVYVGNLIVKKIETKRAQKNNN
ncbi:MAG: phosphatase PAP2 family protein [Clostridia bacterium]|nr:phosphatase PAP2 family protein [Clostridia bacterium]